MTNRWSARGVRRVSRRGVLAGGAPGDGSRSAELSRRIAAEVRRELARDLHDRVAQTLTTMVVEAESYKSEHAGQARVVSQMDAMQSSAREVLSNLRQLVYDLRDDESGSGGFPDAIDAFLRRYQTLTGIHAELTTGWGWPATLRAPAAANLRGLIGEALNNVRRHSGASSVRVVLSSASGERLTVTVSDDGCGLENELIRSMGLGMTGMNERTVLLGGRLVIDGTPGKGTVVRASFPRAQLTEQQGRAN